MIRRIVAAFLVLASMSTLVAVATPSIPAYAACKQGRLLTFPTWYRGLPLDSDCAVKSPSGEDAIRKYVAQIIINVIDILTQVAGYVCIVFIIIGGFRYLTSAGSPQGMTSARKTILNAVVGLVIAIFAVLIVNLIGAAF